jgi:Ubiquitin family/PUB domain
MTETMTVNLTVTATPAAPRISLSIPKDVSSSELRRLVSEKTTIPLDKLRLITRGKLISNNDANNAIEEYKLEEGTVLHCMGKPEGGATAPAAAAGAAPVPSTTAGSSVTVQPQAAASTAAAASSSNPLQAAFAALKAENPPQTYATAVTTLEKILSNIINKPMEEKYRKVRRA